MHWRIGGKQMQDRPDLIQSELAGLAFDSLQQVFRKQDILMMFETDPLPLMVGQPIWIVIDPAAGGPQSDYAVVSVCRVKGCVVVRVPLSRMSSRVCVQRRVHLQPRSKPNTARCFLLAAVQRAEAHGPRLCGAGHWPMARSPFINLAAGPALAAWRAALLSI